MFTLLEFCNYDVRIRHREHKTAVFGCSQADITHCFVLPVLLASLIPVCSARSTLCWLTMALSQSVLLCKHSKTQSSDGKLEPISKAASAVKGLLSLDQADVHPQI